MTLIEQITALEEWCELERQRNRQLEKLGVAGPYRGRADAYARAVGKLRAILATDAARLRGRRDEGVTHED
jgi:hypothetical protein